MLDPNPSLLSFTVVAAIVTTAGALFSYYLKEAILAKSFETWKQRCSLDVLYRKYRDPIVLSAIELANQLNEVCKEHPIEFLATNVSCTSLLPNRNSERDLPASKDYSTAAYLLSNFLLMDSGNAMLNSKGHKIIAYSVAKLLDVMKIEHTRENRAKKQFLDALREIRFITKTTPGLKELSAMKSSKLMNQVVHIHIPKDAERLDGSIKSNHLGAK